MSYSDVLVAGAGITGMGVALGLSQGGVASRILERRENTGGMSAVWQEEGVSLHPGVHLLHASSDAMRPTLQRMHQLMQPDCKVVRPTSALHFLDRYLSFPLKTRELALALGPMGLAQVATSAARSRVDGLLQKHRGQVPADTFENVVQEAFGDRFYRLFFRDYTAKVLGLDPTLISGEWARRRVPMPSKRDLLLRLFPFYRPQTVEHAHPSFPVGQLTGQDGLGSLFEGVLRQCQGHATLSLQSELTQVHLENRQVRSVRWRHTDATGQAQDLWSDQRPFLFSTIPLPELVQRITPRLPSHVLQAAQSLKFRGLVYVFLEVFRNNLHPAQWTYFQSPTLSFNRLSEYSNIIPGAYGEGRTVVCAEITAEVGDTLFDASETSLRSMVADDLKSVVPGLKDSEMGRCWVKRERHAYPVYDLEFQRNRAVVLEFLDGISGLVTVGRQGRFDYLNMDECFQLGLDAATSVVTKP